MYHISFVAVLLVPHEFTEKSPKRGRQDINPGNNDNEDAPIGYFVIKDDLIDMSVKYQ